MATRKNNIIKPKLKLNGDKVRVINPIKHPRPNRRLKLEESKLTRVYNNDDRYIGHEYKQLCVWPGTTLGNSKYWEFEDYFEKMGFHIKFEDIVKTLPTIIGGRAVPGTGKRSDIFFYIATEDIEKFSIARLYLGIKWWEEVLNKGDKLLYTEEFRNKHPKLW